MTRVRVATADDVSDITRVVNAAFAVEAFFKAGDRTDDAEVRSLMSSGEFLLVEELGQPITPTIVACVYAQCRPPTGTLAMLSVDPTRQRRGLGRQLIDAVTTRCRSTCCLEVEIHVVNLRQELPGLYHRLGFVETATRPFPDDGSATRPCHFIVMKRPLT